MWLVSTGDSKVINILFLPPLSSHLVRETDELSMNEVCECVKEE